MASGTYLPFIYVGHFQSAGATAVDIDLSDAPSGTPDMAIIWNETAFAGSVNILGLWTRGMADGDASIILNHSTNGMKGVVETTNGLTDTESVTYGSGSAVTITATKKLSIGTALTGADNDEWHFMIVWGNKFEDLGDQA